MAGNKIESEAARHKLRHHGMSLLANFSRNSMAQLRRAHTQGLPSAEPYYVYTCVCVCYSIHHTQNISVYFSVGASKALCAGLSSENNASANPTSRVKLSSLQILNSYATNPF